MTQRRPRVEKRDYLAFARHLPCLICRDTVYVEASHVRYQSYIHGKGETGVGRKPDDRFAVPLCHEHHMEQHAHGERNWWVGKGIDPLVVAALLYSHFTVDDEDAARQVVVHAREICRWAG